MPISMKATPFLKIERKRACREYVSRHLKGLSKFNPRPGFSDNVYKSRTGIAAGIVPFEHALKAAAAGGAAGHS